MITYPVQFVIQPLHSPRPLSAEILRRQKNLVRQRTAKKTGIS